MIYRFAKANDVNILAKLHLECGENQPGGFMFKLGLPFLKTYYKLLINEKNSIVLVAENENGDILGFCSGTMLAEEHLSNLQKNRLRIGLSILPAIIKSPGMLANILSREKFVFSKDNYIQFGVMVGPRAEYWTWKHDDKSNGAIKLFKTWQKVLFDLGAVSIKGEVDTDNANLFIIYKFLGAKAIGKLYLEDGRHRSIIEYSNKNRTD